VFNLTGHMFSISFRKHSAVHKLKGEENCSIISMKRPRHIEVLLLARAILPSVFLHGRVYSLFVQVYQCHTLCHTMESDV